MIKTRKTIDITQVSKDTRLSEPSDGNRFEWRKLINKAKELGRPLSEEEAKSYRVR